MINVRSSSSVRHYCVQLQKILVLQDFCTSQSSKQNIFIVSVNPNNSITTSKLVSLRQQNKLFCSFIAEEQFTCLQTFMGAETASFCCLKLYNLGIPLDEGFLNAVSYLSYTIKDLLWWHTKTTTERVSDNIM